MWVSAYCTWVWGASLRFERSVLLNVTVILCNELALYRAFVRTSDEEELNVRPGDLSNRFACLRAIFENVFDGGRDIRVGLKRQFAYIVIIGVEVGTGIDG